MRHFKKLSAREIIVGVTIGLLFLTSSFFSEQFARALQSRVGRGGLASMSGYMGSVIALALIPTGSTLPLIPVAVTVWGRSTAALLTVIGWTISEAVAFYVARRFGGEIVTKLVPLRHVKQMRSMIPRENLYVGVFILALIGAPADLASYALGLFTDINMGAFLFLLGLGQLPFAFFVSFTASLPIVYQTYIVGIMIAAWFFFYSKIRGNRGAPACRQTGKPMGKSSKNHPPKADSGIKTSGG